ncbi:hypothetical protein [Rhizobium sp. M10]|jgi:hypothetical protein|nr:hypothetical protein [Rhizobium sp. M10]
MTGDDIPAEMRSFNRDGRRLSRGIAAPGKPAKRVAVLHKQV